MTSNSSGLTNDLESWGHEEYLGLEIDLGVKGAVTRFSTVHGVPYGYVSCRVTASGWGTPVTTAKPEGTVIFKLWSERLQVRNPNKSTHPECWEVTCPELRHTANKQERIRSVRYYCREQAAITAESKRPAGFSAEAGCWVVNEILVHGITYRSCTSHN